MKRLVALIVSLAVAGPAAEASEDNSHETPFGTLRFGGSGDISGGAQSLSLWTQLREISGSPWFASCEGRVGQEKYENYDLHRWGATAGAGRAMPKELDLEVRYRLDQYSVFDVSPDTDPAIRSVQGLNEVGAFALLLQKDSRDDSLYATDGMRILLLGELAFRQAGGDHDFGRLEGDLAWYASPFRDRAGLWEDLTLAGHLRAGWVEDLGGTEGVPFFERYFAGGSSTVRGHRSRWLTPRGIGEQFIGGEILWLNNVEIRMPIFKERFGRRLSAAGFFDAGRAFRRISDVGDFGYGLGAGLRYVVHLWEIHGVLRADYGFNPAREGDDSRSNLHVTFGMPF